MTRFVPDTDTIITNASQGGSGPAPVTVARGDGIGPEIMQACLEIMQAAGARLEIEEVDIGERVYRAGHSAGITRETWDSLRRTGVFYKAPITTPQGGGFKSLNVTIRKGLGLYANVRPCMARHPFIPSRHPGMDVVVIRENEEDLYAGIEHRQTQDVYQCLKLITRPGCERIVRFAFEYARAHQRRRVSCFTKDNIMKLTDGLFHKVFDQIAGEYPDIESDHHIIDIAAARLADDPGSFDVIVTPNLYGDIVSDIAAQITGSVGLGGSANIGDRISMFEAIHGSAPPLAGLDQANPSGLLMAGVMLLLHVGQRNAAEAVHNAWLRTIEDGVHTGDIHDANTVGEPVGARAFAAAVIERLGQQPRQLAAVDYGDTQPLQVPPAAPRRPGSKQLVGVDVFVEWADGKPEDLARQLQTIAGEGLELQMITNRGIKVWPEGLDETFCTDHWRCRFMAGTGDGCRHAELAALLARAAEAGLDTIKTENLYDFDGQPGYSLGQGQ